MRVGLTGGVGAGKSTVARLLADRGAVVIDADAVSREVVQRGTPGLAAVVARFGPDVVGPNGDLDRPALARIVFSDATARADLEGILHPLVAARSAELMEAAPPDSVTVYEVPLLAENDLAAAFDMVVVVEADEDVRLERLVARGLSLADAKARIAAQATDEQRREIADEVVRNDGSVVDLARRADLLWRELRDDAAV